MTRRNPILWGHIQDEAYRLQLADKHRDILPLLDRWKDATTDDDAQYDHSYYKLAMRRIEKAAQLDEGFSAAVADAAEDLILAQYGEGENTAQYRLFLRGMMRG